MGSLGGWLHDNDALVTLIQLGVFSVLLLSCGKRLIEAFRELDGWLRWLLGAAAVAAAAVSAFWIPAFSGFEALGHEASYLECFTTQSMDGSGRAVSPANSQGWEAFVTYPLVRWTYWLLGAVVGREEGGWLLALNIGFRSMAVVWIGWLATVLSGRSVVGAAAALLMVVHPWHAFWGAAIYNVALPYMFASLSLLLAVLAWRAGSARLLATAASAGVLVMAARVEWAILAPTLLILLLGLGPAWGRAPQVATLRYWVPGVWIAVLGALSVLLAGGQLTEQGGYHGIGGYLETLARQAWIIDLIEPFHLPWTLLAALAGMLVMKQMLPGGGRAALGLLGFFLVGYLALSTFNDFSYRHALLPGIGLVLLASLLAVPIVEAKGARRWVAALFFVSVMLSGALGVHRVASRYYLSQDDFFARHEGFRGTELAAAEVESGECFLITDNERLWQMGIAGSHFNLMDPGEAVTHWRRFGGCVRWLFDNAGYRYDGLAVPPRSTKLKRWFAWDYEGWARLDEGEVLIYRMREPPWGIGDDEPVPETEFRLPGEQDPEEEPEDEDAESPEEGSGDEQRGANELEIESDGQAPSGVDSAP